PSPSHSPPPPLPPLFPYTTLFRSVVTGVSDVKGGIWNPNGLDIRQLEAHIAESGGVSGFPGTDAVSNTDLLERPCDVLIPAAVGDRKSTRLNSSHRTISYAVFCLK